MSPIAGMPLALGPEEAFLRPSGALWLARHAALLVADLHLEKGSAYAARGQMLPPFDTDDTLGRLETEIGALEPRVVVFLGDALHDGGAEDRLPARSIARLEALAGGRRLIWIAGNHDRAGPRRLPGERAEHLRLGALDCIHEPGGGRGEFEAAGHLHPCAKVAGVGGSVRRRCFVTDGRRIVLPAFGAYAGGLNVRDRAFRPLFRERPTAAVLGHGRVHPIAWRWLRGD